VLREGVGAGEFHLLDVKTSARLIIHAFANYPFEAYEAKNRKSIDAEVESMFHAITRGISNVR
jgi:hypothetical protein